MCVCVFILYILRRKGRSQKSFKTHYAHLCIFYVMLFGPWEASTLLHYLLFLHTEKRIGLMLCLKWMMQMSWNWRKILEVFILGQFVLEKVRFGKILQINQGNYSCYFCYIFDFCNFLASNIVII